MVERIRTPLERALRDANLRPEELDEVVLVGGATRMPLVARTVTKMLGRLPLRHVNPDQAIALGAVVASGMKARNAKLEEVILTDVCPYTLGTDLIRRDEKGTAHLGYFAPIIQRNSTVPVSRELEVWPAYDEQYELHVGVFQGENPVAAKNVKLGEFLLDLPREGRRQERGVIVRYTYDINGLLIVNVKVKKTGEEHELVLQQNPGDVDAGRDQGPHCGARASENASARQAGKSGADRPAERLYEELARTRRHPGMIIQFQGILETQDEKRDMDRYYTAAEAAGWPDRLDRGEFAFGWDRERRRGVITDRMIHIVDDGIGDLDRAARGVEVQWDFYGAFGFSAALVNPGDQPYPLDMKITAPLLREKGIALHGTVDEIVEKIIGIRDGAGYGEDFMLNCHFELAGFKSAEIEEQMRCFAERVMPAVAKECGGHPPREESTVDFSVT